MEVTIYFSTGFYSEKSTIFKATDLVIDEVANVRRFVKIDNTDTTTSNLYRDGWRLVQVVKLDNFCSAQLIFEKPTN